MLKRSLGTGVLGYLYLGSDGFDPKDFWADKIAQLHHSVTRTIENLFGRSENCSCWRYKEKELGALEKPGEDLPVVSWHWLRLALEAWWWTSANCAFIGISGSLKLANIGECIPQKLANTINQCLFPQLWNPVVKYLPAQHCLWPKNSSYLLPTYLTYNAETGMG